MQEFFYQGILFSAEAGAGFYKGVCDSCGAVCKISCVGIAADRHRYCQASVFSAADLFFDPEECLGSDVSVLLMFRCVLEVLGELYEDCSDACGAEEVACLNVAIWVRPDAYRVVGICCDGSGDEVLGEAFGSMEVEWVICFYETF